MIGEVIMKCDDCIFHLKELDTCMFCSFIKSNNVDDDFQKGMKDRLGEDYKTYVESVMFKDIPKCEHQEKEEFDILKLDSESDFCDQWSHKKVLSRLHNNRIDCFFVDIWGCDEIAVIFGINSRAEDVARVLGIHKECIYHDWEHDYMILNLFQEKVLRENGA